MCGEPKTTRSRPQLCSWNIYLYPLVSPYQYLRNQKTPVIAPSSRRSSPLSQTWNSATVDATWWLVIISQWRCGTSTWRASLWKPTRYWLCRLDHDPWLQSLWVYDDAINKFYCHFWSNTSKGIDHLCFRFCLWQVHDYLRSKLCSLYENDCIFDKFECVWNGTDRFVKSRCVQSFSWMSIFQSLALAWNIQVILKTLISGSDV